MLMSKWPQSMGWRAVGRAGALTCPAKRSSPFEGAGLSVMILSHMSQEEPIS
jgi:hypothetical protein